MIKKYFFIISIIIEIGIIGLLAYSISKKNNRKTFINPINKENIIFSDTHSSCYDYAPSVTTKGENPLNTSVYYSTNNDSLSDSHNYSEKKDPEVFRIITLGDSFTAGLFVNIEENWTEILENLLNKTSCKTYKKIEVINLGVSGYDVSCSVYRYTKKGKKYNPDLIIWLLKEDDFSEYREKMAKRAEELFNMLPPEKKKEYRGPWGEIYAQAVKEFYKEYTFEEVVNFQKNIIYDLINSYTGKILLTTFEDEKIKNILGEYTSIKNNIYVYDHLANISNTEYSFLPKDSHPNVKGHELIAKDIFIYLEENNIIPCESSD